jgi:TfoX/Sxy family transcriptional regulator of competence genes
MAYNEKLADRVRELIAQSHQDIEEKKMFSGVCFMVNGKMCVGIQKDRLMVRLDPGMIEQVVEKQGCRQMEMNGKTMKAFVLVEEPVITTRKKLEYWIKLALDYNPIAKASKKKNK